MDKLFFFNVLAVFFVVFANDSFAETTVTSMEDGVWQVKVEKGAEQVSAQFPAQPEVAAQDPNFDESYSFELIVQNGTPGAEFEVNQVYRLVVSRDLDVLSLEDGQEVSEAVRDLLPQEVQNEQIAIRVKDEINEQTVDHYVWQGTITKEYVEDGQWKLLDTVALRIIVSDKLITIASFAGGDASTEQIGDTFLKSVQHEVR